METNRIEISIFKRGNTPADAFHKQVVKINREEWESMTYLEREKSVEKLKNYLIDWDWKNVEA